MIRITELRLPLEYPADSLSTAIAERLSIANADVLAFNVFKRGYDARKRDGIVLVYTIDVTVRDDAAILAKFPADPHVKIAPDTSYRFVAHLQEAPALRPVIVGFGPCGLMAGLVLAQMGFRPIILELAKKSANALKIRGHCGARTSLTPNPTCSLVKVVRGRFPTASSTAKLKTRNITGAKSSMNLSKQVHRKKFSTSASRISARSAW